MKRVNIAVVGCGYWGSKIIRNINQLKGCFLYTCCDINRKRLTEIKEKYSTVNTTTSYNELINDKNIDAIIIATPATSHFRLAKKALENGKHTLVEKPMTTSLGDAKKLVDLAKDNNKILMVDHTFEFSPVTDRIKKAIQNGELGDIYYIRLNWLNFGIFQSDININWDLAGHIFSILTYILEMNPLKISASADSYIREGVEEIAHIRISFPQKIKAYVSLSWLHPIKTRNITIVGSKKILVSDYLDDSKPIKIYNPNKKVYSPSVKKIEPLKLCCEHFVECIVNSKKPKNDGISGSRVVHLLEVVEESIRKGKAVIIN